MLWVLNIGIPGLIHLPQASTFGGMVDCLYTFIYWLSAISLAGVTAAMLCFLVRYRRARVAVDNTPYIEGNTALEVGVSVILTIFVMAIFYWGWRDYKIMLDAPAGALEVNVVAKQWKWQFEYQNGRKTDDLVVPLGRPVKLLMSATDVIHSFYVPDFRIKQDVVPGAYTQVWFTALLGGTHQIFCAEFCGTGHSAMLAHVDVKAAIDYDTWQKQWELRQRLGISSVPLTQPSPQMERDSTKATAPTTTADAGLASLAERGKKAFAEKGCTACHSDQGVRLVGPPLNKIFGTTVELENGKSATVDENYLRESLMDPQAKLVRGFPPVMPTFRGVLSDDETNALVAFIKSLKN